MQIPFTLSRVIQDKSSRVPAFWLIDSLCCRNFNSLPARWLKVCSSESSRVTPRTIPSLTFFKRIRMFDFKFKSSARPMKCIVTLCSCVSKVNNEREKILVSILKVQPQPCIRNHDCLLLIPFLHILIFSEQVLFISWAFLMFCHYVWPN